MAKYAYHRKDANHDEIVAALEDVGATVYPVGRPVDLLVGYRGVNYLIEVKAWRGTPEVRQIAFFAAWKGQVICVQSTEDALKAIGAL